MLCAIFFTHHTLPPSASSWSKLNDQYIVLYLDTFFQSCTWQPKLWLQNYFLGLYICRSQREHQYNFSIRFKNVEKKTIVQIWFSSSLLGCIPSSFLPSLNAAISERSGLEQKNSHGLNKVQSDFRLWDLQTNPAWVSWGPGSGINCYISWPSSRCLSQPAWLGPRLARNHGLPA